jgi:hypothetical protein
MKITLLTLTLIFGLLNLSKGQTNTNEPSKAPIWTEADRKYLVDNLIRSKEEIIVETKNLTKEQWNFKESPDRWSINQIVEHICLWELIPLNVRSSAALTAWDLFLISRISLPDSAFINKVPRGLNTHIT